MAIYVFSLLAGFKPNGVDNAQGYRARMLKEFSCPIYHIFTELPKRRYISRYRKEGIAVGQMLSLHSCFTDNQTLELSVRVEDKLAELEERLQYTRVELKEKEIRLIKGGFYLVSIFLDEEDSEYLHAISYYNHGRLLRTENYTDGISYIDYYVTEASERGLYAKEARRTFYNRDGSVAYDQIFEGSKEWYLFPNGRRCTKSEFIGEFVKKLDLKENDIVLLDRSSQFDFVQPLFQFGNQARFIAVLHSGHYFEKGEDRGSLYLNSEYYYWFKYSGKIDTMVVSTEEQKEALTEKLREYKCIVPDIEVIPAGGLDCLKYPEKGRRPFSLLSVSRLNRRKKLDWVIRGVIEAHRRCSNISLDLYGYGEDEQYTQYLQGIVAENDANSYIRFMGHRNVMDIYKDYEVYLSASLWETLGLSIMEAVGSGLAVIGLNVKYGNRLFIHPGENGYLVDFDLGYVLGDDSALIHEIADRITEIFEDDARLKRFHQHSYEIAADFSWDIIKEKWRKLLMENDVRETLENIV